MSAIELAQSTPKEVAAQLEAQGVDLSATSGFVRMPDPDGQPFDSVIVFSSAGTIKTKVDWVNQRTGSGSTPKAEDASTADTTPTTT